LQAEMLKTFPRTSAVQDNFGISGPRINRLPVFGLSQLQWFNPSQAI